ncbi:MAG: winged helix-turn-helix domain-containing protein [Candidatus Thermoplasmatota archaeon]|nr:winged helix-turn-helix domain-containing protein [Candidatus Thermoplasmatota archaeon]
MYEEVGHLLKLITYSGLRAKMMMSLMEGPKTSGQLRDEIGVSSPNVIHAARELEKEKLLIGKEDGYHLTSIGNVISSKLLDMVSTMAVLEKNKDFWLAHDMQGIPKEFLDRIDELGEAEIIKSTPTNVIKGFTYYFQLVRNAKKVMGVSPILHPRFPPIIEKIVTRGVDVKLILTEEIFEIGKKKYHRLFQELINKENFQVWISEDPIKVAFTVTDSLLSFALFNLDGTFDSSNDLVSKNKGAINWGRELFEHYRKRAHKIREGT